MQYLESLIEDAKERNALETDVKRWVVKDKSVAKYLSEDKEVFQMWQSEGMTIKRRIFSSRIDADSKAQLYELMGQTGALEQAISPIEPKVNGATNYGQLILSYLAGVATCYAAFKAKDFIFGNISKGFQEGVDHAV